MYNTQTKLQLLLAALFMICVINVGCTSSENDPDSTALKEWKCGTHNGKQLWTGPRGGCYYYNSKRNKVYVDRNECNC